MLARLGKKAYESAVTILRLCLATGRLSAGVVVCLPFQRLPSDSRSCSCSVSLNA
jgi:hypothetical protein